MFLMQKCQNERLKSEQIKKQLLQRGYGQLTVVAASP